MKQRLENRKILLKDKGKLSPITLNRKVDQGTLIENSSRRQLRKRNNLLNDEGKLSKIVKTTTPITLNRKVDQGTLKDISIQIFHDSILKDYNSLQTMELSEIFLIKLNRVECFLKFFNNPLQNEILNKIKSKTDFNNYEKTALNCISISISTINMMMKDVSPSIILHVISFVSNYEPYSESNAISRRIVEMSLYCLCNYFEQKNNSTLEKEFLIDYCDALIKCFKSKSEKIKISSSIILSFLDTSHLESGVRSDLLRCLNYIYLNIKPPNKGEYFGIIESLISSSILRLDNN